MPHPNLHAILFLGLVSSTTSAQPAFTPVTDAMLQSPDPADWLMWRRNLGHWGFSPLEQINRTNVRELRLVWTRPLNPRVREGTPLVYATSTIADLPAHATLNPFPGRAPSRPAQGPRAAA